MDIKEAEAFVQLVETRVEIKFEGGKNHLAAKEDLAREIIVTGTRY